MGNRVVVSLLCLLALTVAGQAATFTLVDLPATGTDDAIGIDSSTIYTHAFDFGTSPVATINGVIFEAGPSANITAAYTGTSAQGYGYTLSDTRSSVAVSVHAGSDPSTQADGASIDLFYDMIYHSASTTIGAGLVLVLSDLTPGVTYSARLYYRSWGTGETARTITCQADGESNGVFAESIDIELDGGGAHYLDYTFTADDTDVEFRFLTNDDNNGIHVYGFTNEVLGSDRATVPSPADKAVDVFREPQLTWKPGDSAVAHDVYLGTSYDDVAAATVADPRGVLVSSNQAVVGYDSSRLEFGQTYYWRVDEVGGAPDHAVFAGNVWSFTVEPLAYAVENIVATSNGLFETTTGPENTINGSGLNAQDQHSNLVDDMWQAEQDGDAPLWIQYEFDRTLRLYQMLVWNYNVQFEPILGFGIKDATIEYSTDGADWTVLGNATLAQANGTSASAANTTIDLAGVAAKYIRLTVNSGWGTMDQYGLSEVRFLHIPGFARRPQPASGATNLAPEIALTWRPGREAARHDLYIGTDQQAVADGTADVTTVSKPRYDAALNLGQTYYWRVDEVNEVEEPAVWTSDLWTFSVADSIVIEDFETYNDDDNRIYDTWLDGWVNDTGSTVGYFNSPFAETTLAHSGKQSMPLLYENTNGTSVSEAQRTFEISHDWSVHGIQSLSLVFFGDRANTAGQLYAKINGTKVLYGGSAEDLKIAAWIPWTIDLTGLNVGNVTTLTIGVEGAGATGTLFIDNIRVYPYASEQIAPVQPDDASLVACYPLDGNANDTAGGHHGTISGTPDFMAGYQGQALDLASNATVPQYVSVPYSDAFALNSFTIAAWINVKDLDALRAILGTRFNSDNTFDLKVEATRVHGDIGDGSVWLNTNVDIPAARGGVVGTNAWHHIAYAIDAATGTADLYLDGVLSTTVTFAGMPLFMKPDQELRIGNCSGTEYMNGMIDEVRIYNRALSMEEVAALVGRPGPIYTGF